MKLSTLVLYIGNFSIPVKNYFFLLGKTLFLRETGKGENFQQISRKVLNV